MGFFRIIYSTLWFDSFLKHPSRAPTILKKGKPLPRHRASVQWAYFKMMCARQKLRQTRVWTLAASGDRRPTDAEWASSLHLFIFPWKRNIFQEQVNLLICTGGSIQIFLKIIKFTHFCDLTPWYFLKSKGIASIAT